MDGCTPQYNPVNYSVCVVCVAREDLKSLTYLKYCIKESLRLFPPVPGVGRMLAQPTEIDGHKLPKNTPIVCCPYAIHRNSDVWENPEVSHDSHVIPLCAHMTVMDAFYSHIMWPHDIHVIAI